MQLLVSVSDAVEADAALDGGTDIVDAKDPASGPLGPVTLEAFQAIRLRVADVRPLSAALGDPVDQEEAHRMASAFVRNGAGFVKVGFLAARDLGDVRRLLTATVAGAADGAQGHPTDGGAIAVAYADHAGAVTPWQLIDIARRAGATGILLDTANKAGPGLLSLMSSVELRMWMREASSAGLVVGVAGRLSEDDVAQLRDSEADIVGVRGAACIGGRRGHVSADQVRRLRALFTVQVV